MERWAASEWRAEELVGGHPVLDFVNTAGGASKARDAERLATFADFVGWSVVARVLDDDEAAGLIALAETGPKCGDDVLTRAVAFREALHALLMAYQAGQALPRAALDHVEGTIRASLSQARLVRREQRLIWCAEPIDAPPALPLLRLGLLTHDLLTGDMLASVRNCERCSWLFLARGRGKPRRWCSMASCGNRAKAARHYAREKQRAGRDA